MRWRTGAVALAAAMAIGLSGCAGAEAPAASDPVDEITDPEQLAQLEQLRHIAGRATDATLERVLVVHCETPGQAYIRLRLTAAAEGDGEAELAAAVASFERDGISTLDDGVMHGYDRYLVETTRPKGIASVRLGIVNDELRGSVSGDDVDRPDFSAGGAGTKLIEVRLAGPCVGQPEPIVLPYPSATP
ncbi:MAG: hypothetical protein ABW204_04730 [Microbacteriaceae bacterium]